MIGKLFKGKKPTATTAPTVSFKDYAKANFNESFFTKTLKLQPGQTTRFLDYCEADPQSKTAMASNDELTLLQFMMAKKAAFDKL